MDEEQRVRYHLYGRTAYAQPLTFVKTVTVAHVGELALPAGEAWVELVAFPETAVIHVIPSEGRPTKETAS